jgi:hypothetical protein
MNPPRAWPNFALHWTGSSRFSLLQSGRPRRLLPASELVVKCMNLSARKAASGWRLALVASEVTMIGFLAASASAGPKTRINIGLIPSLLVFVAFGFLFLGSPFLVRSQGWLAIVGWCIAASALLFSVL